MKLHMHRSCHMCGKEFKRKQNADIHLMGVHGLTKEDLEAQSQEHGFSDTLETSSKNWQDQNVKKAFNRAIKSWNWEAIATRPRESAAVRGWSGGAARGAA